MLLVFGSGAAIGLQSGLNLLLVWRSPWTVLIALGFSFLYSAVAYGMWRWVFPVLRPRSVSAEIALHTLVSFAVFMAVETGPAGS